MTTQKRKHLRVVSQNLLSYDCLDENDQIIVQGMGRTLNISEGGILLETHVPIDPKYILEFTIAMEDDLMDMRGKITYNRKREGGKHEIGIQFIEADEATNLFLKQFVTIFKEERDG